LAAFAAGWDLEAAIAMCAWEPLAAHQVLESLASLVDKSLVMAEDVETPTVIREPRSSAHHELAASVFELDGRRVVRSGAFAVWAARLFNDRRIPDGTSRPFHLGDRGEN